MRVQIPLSPPASPLRLVVLGENRGRIWTDQDITAIRHIVTVPARHGREVVTRVIAEDRPIALPS
jgi:hypothetical protein